MSVLWEDAKRLKGGLNEFKEWLAPSTLSGRLVRMAPVGVGLGVASGAVLPALTDHAPIFQPSEGGGPSLAHELLNAHNEGTRRMTPPPIGYGTAKFGGVKLEKVARVGLDDALNLVSGLFGQVGPVARTVTQTVGDADPTITRTLTEMSQAPAWKRLLGVGAPLILGGAALEMLDPLSDVLAPTAKDMGARLSQRMGYAESPHEQAMQKGIDAFAAQAAKELASGLAGGVGGGMRAGVDLFRRGTPLSSMIQGDPILSRATPGQEELLAQSFGAMQRVAPQLAREPFVAKNYLRDVLITNNGPDHATLSSLAKSEQTIMDARGGGRR